MPKPLVGGPGISEAPAAGLSRVSSTIEHNRKDTRLGTYVWGTPSLRRYGILAAGLEEIGWG
jgi:hypothetical protein